MKRLVQILGIGAPLSWLLVPLMAIPASQGTDGGWSGMHAMFQALAIILIIHIICLLGLLVALAVRIWKRQNVGKGLALALIYFAVILLIFIMGSGSQEFWRDCSALLLNIFGNRQ